MKKLLICFLILGSFFSSYSMDKLSPEKIDTIISMTWLVTDIVNAAITQAGKRPVLVHSGKKSLLFTADKDRDSDIEESESLPHSPTAENFGGSPHSEEVVAIISKRPVRFSPSISKYTGPRPFMEVPLSPSISPGTKFCRLCHKSIPAGKWESHMRKMHKKGNHKKGFRKKSR